MENRGFNTSDVLGVYAALLVVGLTIFGVARSAAHSYGGSEAHRQMSQLARQIASQGFSTILEDPDTGQRKPASIGNDGRIGRDPWGSPYTYKVFEYGNGRKAIVLLSPGPNRKRDVKDTDFVLSASGQPLRVLQRGDDLSHVEFGL
jgi:hypothetical protein